MERTLHLLLVLCLCFLYKATDVCMGCRDEERQALLVFKQCKIRHYDQGLYYELPPAWNSTDCCKWEGVGCSNETSHIVSLAIPNFLCRQREDYFPSLSALKHLQHLDLSDTNIISNMPQSIGSITSLRYLDLSSADYSNTILPHIQNLTSLQHLDFGFALDLNVDSLMWLSHLSSLKYLDLSYVNLSKAADWQVVFTKLPVLHELRLSGCSLQTPPDPFSSSRHPNVSSIAILDLSSNQFQDSTKFEWLSNLSQSLVNLNLGFCDLHGPVPRVLENLSSLEVLRFDFNHLNGTVPESLGNLTKLKILDVSNNNLQGLVPGILGNLCNLENLDFSENKIVGDLSGLLGNKPACKRYKLSMLDLSGNKISGSIPDWIGQMRNLKNLYMYGNLLNGSLPVSLGQLSELVFLDLTSNSMQGVLSEAHFSNLTNLVELHLSFNNLTFNVSANWVPPFQLHLVEMTSCRVGPKFPSWLQNQMKLTYIDISDTGIIDVMPSWIWNVSSEADYLNISNNQIRGEISDSHKIPSAIVIDLSSNLLQGQLPFLNSSVQAIFLNENNFIGDVLSIINKEMSYLTEIMLSQNFLTGEIPSDVCDKESIQILDLSYNAITGELPQCHMDSNTYRYFSVINLASNYLHGLIPQWICGGIQSTLQILNLRNNNFYGQIPPLFECPELILLDLGENNFTGNIPTSIGESTALSFLSLRANRLSGTIPSELSRLPLQFLDLGHNDLSGIIPLSFSNLSRMTQPTMDIKHFLYPNGNSIVIHGNFSGIARVRIGVAEAYEERMWAVMKGKQLEYSNTITLVVLLDLSCNRLTGEVPTELMNLVGLQTLNLSENHMTGKVPDKIGNMIWLETLDLSRNHLSGEIPRSISFLTKLNHLNLSYNNLSGRIPSGNQLQTLTDSSIYVGNPNLCGSPLQVCPGDEPSKVPVSPTRAGDDDDDSDKFELYLSMGLGYAVGLLGLCGMFLFKNSWRIACFRFVDGMANKFVVAKETLRRWITLVVGG